MSLQERKSRAWAIRIKRLMKKLGWEPEQLADVLQVRRGTIRKWANATQTPGRKSAGRIRNLEEGVGNVVMRDRNSGRKGIPGTLRARQERSSSESVFPEKGPLNYFDYLKMIDAVSGGDDFDTDDEPEARYLWMIERAGRLPPHVRKYSKRRGFNREALAALEKVRELFVDDIEKFPVTMMQKRYELSEGEVRILVRLISVDTGLFEGSGEVPGGMLAETGGCREESLLEGRKCLAPDAPLRRHKLIEKRASRGGNPWEEEAASAPVSVLRGRYRLSPAAREELLGDLLKMSVLEEADSATADSLDPRFGLEEVILPDSHRAKLEVTVSEIANRSMIFEDWGLGERVHYGKGTILLFGGVPGTGKTMAAEGLAKELGKKIMSASFPKIVSKWLGDTGKNIAALFAAARENDAVLFIDEADGLFASREMAVRSWEIRDVNILLKEIEAFEGVVVLATNHAVVLDKALESRLSLHLQFPMPDERAREAIWARHLPEKLPLADDVNLGELARTYAISGRDIKQAVLMAAGTAAHRAGAHPMVTMKDLKEAARSRKPGNDDTKIGFAG